MKIGRNAPCWCGSGKKFKNCHLGRAQAEKVPLSVALKAAKQSDAGKGCNSPKFMHHECSGDVIKSHTISKSLGLATVSEDGHVLGLKYDISTLTKNNGRAEIGRVGINKISVFPGFCSHHDKSLFSVVEDSPFAHTKEECALLSYRALARERHAKLSGTDVNDFLRDADKGKPLATQIAMQSFLAEYGLGLSLATDDLDRAIAHHHEAISTHDFSAFESAVFEFSDEFPLLCSTGHMPSDDWSGRIVQDLTDPDLKADWLTAVAIHSNGSAWVIFTWLKASKIMADFVASLRTHFEGREADALIKYFFTISENIAIRPAWWHALDKTAKAALEARIMDGSPMNAGANITAPRSGEPTAIELPLKRLILV
jgi:hypothetical protein